jgi:hypothetical protein
MKDANPAPQPAQNVPGVSGLQSVPKMQPGSPMQQSGSGQAGPGSFVPGNNYRMNPPSQTPLAYLEKTTTTIGR